MNENKIFQRMLEIRSENLDISKCNVKQRKLYDEIGKVINASGLRDKAVFDIVEIISLSFAFSMAKKELGVTTENE